MSNALEQASLIMVPSGYEDGTLGSLKPTDGTGDFTFSRGSDISATRVNEDGYIEKGYENLLLQSNSFDTTWGGTGFYSLTSGQSGYDGSNDAWEFDKVAAGNNYITQSSLTNVGVVTASVYAKAGTASGVMIYTENGYGRWNLSTGTLINSGGLPIGSNIEDIGNGWYRCSVTGTSATNYFLKVVDTSGLDTTGSIYIQDAMLNQGMVSYPYVETTTAPVAGGILEDMPRLDYSDSSCPALLLEPQRTNLTPYSEYFDDWTENIPSLTANQGISPEGVQNAYLYQASSSARYVVFKRIPVVSGTTYTLSMWVKSNSGTQKIRIGADNACANPQGAETFEVGTEWQRISTTITSTQTFWNLFFDNIESGIACTGTQLSADLLIYGFQVEVGSYPTSYIPTYGTSQTRLADFPTTTISTDITDSTEGSVYFEFQSIADDNDLALSYFTFNSNVTNNIRFGLTSSGSEIYFRAKKDNVDLFAHTSSISDPTAVNKMAFRWGLNDWKLYLNGLVVYTSTTIATFESGDFTKLESGIGGGAYKFLGNVKQLLVFPTKLSDSELATLTTIS